MANTEYWVYKSELDAEQARVVATGFDVLENADQWCQEQFDDEIVFLQGVESIPYPANGQVFITEVYVA